MSIANLNEMLVDRFGRVHRSLRISVTDRCNIRCQYCMPDGNVQFLKRSDLLTYEQIACFVSIVSKVGLSRIRLTGGEPLVRNELERLVALLKKIDTVESVALTTNGMLLEDQAEKLALAGIDRINISLDTLSESTFKKLSRREGIARVLAGIDAACRVGLTPQLNAVLMRDINSEDALDLVEFAASRNLVIRFIEFMPLDSDRHWTRDQMVSGPELRTMLEERFGPMVPVDRIDPARPAREFRFLRTNAIVGFIDSVSQPFCSGCDRLRMTAEGKLRNCLFGKEEWDVSALLRDATSASANQAAIENLQTTAPKESSNQQQILEVVHASLAGKHQAHGISEDNFIPPERAMYQIGG